MQMQPETFYALHLSFNYEALAGFVQRFGAAGLLLPGGPVGPTFWFSAKLKDMFPHE
jgi:hypothetical protein